ncbi:hypothetical protein WOLCODRAFT_156441 [Wolfiporia cocos MD-104 SS10]|uniref:Uncharacterized protein n=1 Tax=Wolfiporia cocos (strain MD-104) TaxID=742152 RepID=A0A2H3JGA8_WOLCO|nr:hypothetical protein WOLCODRAFT_156441 [Wolfiporia cocos MD-104 SS10]
MFSNRRFLGYDVIFKQYEPRNQSNNSYNWSRSLVDPHSKPISEAARNWYPVVLNNLHPRTCWQELKDLDVHPEAM